MKLIEDITPEDVTRVMKEKGYTIFTDEGIPNIVGIRNFDYDKEDFYNDKCFVWWRKANGSDEWHLYTITTHPGYYYLEHPIEGTKGTAILVPGQYSNAWILGMHRGTQFALCQRAGPVRVYRDSNRDTVLNYDPATIEEGFFGIDIHHASLSNANVIDHWSAGCQVFRYAQAHEILMERFRMLSSMYHFRTFSYTLLMQQDFV